MKAKIYLAGSLFTMAERNWNERLAKAFRDRGYHVILPQEEADRHLGGAQPDFGAIVGDCLSGIRSSDLIVAILDGPDVDSGTAFECGYAHAIGKPLVGVRTDLRSGGEEKGLNAMLSRSLRGLVQVCATKSLDQLVTDVIAGMVDLPT
jgi:nucleoside 2-deoxyribosyltransferase